MEYFYKTNNECQHSKHFPNSFRALIVGPSGAGKTALLMKLLLSQGYEQAHEDNLLNYDKLYVFAKSLYQPEYQILKAGLENNLSKETIKRLLNSDSIFKKYNYSIEQIGEICKTLSDVEKNPSSIECEFSEDPSNIPDPKDIDKSIRNLIIFDDIMTDRKQTTAENYYTRGRSANCDCIYLSQNYTHLPLHTIRSNANFMIFFKSSPMVVEQLYRNFSSIDMDDIKDRKQFCKDAWDKKHGYVVIDLSRDAINSKYRKQIELV